MRKITSNAAKLTAAKLKRDRDNERMFTEIVEGRDYQADPHQSPSRMFDRTRAN